MNDLLAGFYYNVVIWGITSRRAGDFLVDHLGEFEQIILFSVLSLGEEAYGLAIRERIEERTGRVVSSGAIYTSLGRLQDRGLVSSRVETPEDGRVGRPRKYYTLEREGARALRAAWTGLQAVASGLDPKLNELAES